MEPASNVFNENLIFHRWLGHKLEIPGSAQWRMLDKKDSDCWVNERWVYTLFFWSP